MLILNLLLRRIIYQVERSCSFKLFLASLFAIIVVTSRSGNDIFEYTEPCKDEHRKLAIATICGAYMKEQKLPLLAVTDAIKGFKEAATDKYELVLFFDSFDVKVFVDAQNWSADDDVMVRTKSIADGVPVDALNQEMDTEAMICVALDEALSEIANDKDIIQMSSEKFLGR